MKRYKKTSKTRKRILALLFGIVLGTSPLAAQIFIVDGEESNRADNPQLGPGLPGHSGGNDVFAPVGSGAVLLVALGAAYLLAKKNKDEKWED